MVNALIESVPQRKASTVAFPSASVKCFIGRQLYQDEHTSSDNTSLALQTSLLKSNGISTV